MKDILEFVKGNREIAKNIALVPHYHIERQGDGTYKIGAGGKHLNSVIKGFKELEKRFDEIKKGGKKK